MSGHLKVVKSINKVHEEGGYVFKPWKYYFFHLKSTQYKKLAPNALWFTYLNLKSCKSHEKNETKNMRLLVFSFLINKSSILMFFVLFFHVVCEISNFNMWTTKHLEQASCTELTLTKVGNSNVKTGKRYTKKLSGNFQEPVN